MANARRANRILRKRRGKRFELPPEPTHAAGLDLSKLPPAAYWVPTEVVKRWVKNPRENLDAVPGVVESIREFGFGAPLVARVEDGELIAGDTRIQAAEQLGLEQLPVRFMDLNAAKAHLLALADNRLGENAKWIEDLVAEVLDDAEDEGEDIETSGFSDRELARILDDEPDVNARPGVGGLSYQIVIECTDENHQAELLEKLEQKGLKCRPLIL